VDECRDDQMRDENGVCGCLGDQVEMDGFCGCQGDTVDMGDFVCGCPGDTVDMGDNVCGCPGNTVAMGDNFCGCPANQVMVGASTCGCPDTFDMNDNGACVCPPGWILTGIQNGGGDQLNVAFTNRIDGDGIVVVANGECVPPPPPPGGGCTGPACDPVPQFGKGQAPVANLAEVVIPVTGAGGPLEPVIEGTPVSKPVVGAAEVIVPVTGVDFKGKASLPYLSLSVLFLGLGLVLQGATSKKR